MSRLGGAAALALLLLTPACRHEAPAAAAAGGRESGPRTAAPPADTSELLTVPLVAPLADGAREVRRDGAELDSIASREADLRPDSADAMLSGHAESAHSEASPDGGSGPGTADTAPPAAPSDPATEPDPRLPSETGIPVAAGLRLTSVHHLPGGDRENVITLSSATAAGVEYEWRFRDERRPAAPTRETFSRIVSAADLARAPRLNQVFQSGRHESTPGYTAMSLSRAVYAELRRGAAVRFAMTGLDRSALGAGSAAMSGKVGGEVGGLVAEMAMPRVTAHGSLTPIATASESLAVLLDGRRVRLPVLHLRGAFTYDDKPFGGDYWVLADSADPLILREAGDGEELRIIRIDRPSPSPVEGELAGGRCRAELPGVYFAFASAELEPESDAALAGVARLLASHPDWSLTIEGHTDSIGGPASNQALSERRAAAVRAALVSGYGVAASRLAAKGFGATHPLESNATIEGRARNRRVEAVRPCGS